MDTPPRIRREDIDPRLQRLLGGDALAPLRQRLRRHFERKTTHGEDRTRSLRLGRLDPLARETLAQLSGRPVKRGTQSMQIDLDMIDLQLRRAGLAHSLRDALEKLDGPIVSARAEREAMQARWAASQADATPGSLLHRWLSTPDSQRLLRRLARHPEGARVLLSDAERVLQALPCPPQPRSQLAAQVLGDAHALDSGRPVATLVLAAWRHHEQENGSCKASHPPAPHHATPSGQGGSKTDENTRNTDDVQEKDLADERQRDIWARAGVLVNELARPALFLNLPTRTTPTADAIAGEPAYLSLRQLLHHPPAWEVAGRLVHVCENPNLLAIAADRLGAHCPPLVCTDGMPAAAQRTLLDQLQHAGARLCYHGDFDWPGIRIANLVLRRWHAEPWRMRAKDYEEAARRVPASTTRLDGHGIEACWDRQLLTVMQCHRLAIPEEALADLLMADLAAATCPRSSGHR
ncbi:MAG: TIGR02679 family protein [Lautropia sp.]|nr:TIGR02679 family protein [Lautropia sp.]